MMPDTQRKYRGEGKDLAEEDKTTSHLYLCSHFQLEYFLTMLEKYRCGAVIC